MNEYERKISRERKMFFHYIENLKYTHIRTFSGLHGSSSIRLIDKDGQLHEIAKEIVRVNQGIRLAKILKEILLSEGEECDERCVAIYRDAIAFYNQKDKMVGLVHLCLECGFIEYEGNRIRLTVSGRDDFNEILMFLGHGKAEEEEVF